MWKERYERNATLYQKTLATDRSYASPLTQKYYIFGIWRRRPFPSL